MGPDRPPGYNTSTAGPRRAVLRQHAVTLAGITDGTSNTAATAEKLMGDFNTAVATPNRDIYVGTIMPTTPEETYLLCQQIDPTSTPSNGRVGQRRTLDSWQCGDFGLQARVSAQHDVLLLLPGAAHIDRHEPPSRRRERRHVRRLGPVLQATRSTAPSGCAIGSRNGGEVISSDSY